MWKQDGPDMLYCDGFRIFRVRPVHLPEHPFVIEVVRILTIGEHGIPDYWPINYADLSSKPTTGI